MQLLVTVVLALAAHAASVDAYTCPAGRDCVGQQIVPVTNGSVPCARGFYCPGGPAGEYFICKAGFYCPTPAQQIKCPSGKYCPSGSPQPYDCMPLSLCPEESKQQRWVLLLILLIIAVFATYIAFKRYNVYRRKVIQLSIQNASQPAPLPGALNGVGSASPRKAARSGELVTSPSNGHSATTLLNKDDQKAPAPMQPETGKDVKLPLPSPERSETSARRIPVTITVNNVNVQLPGPDGKVVSLLQSFSGKFRSGRVTAIMGPSGSGKSSVLNVLSARLSATSGSINVNGIEDLTRLKRVLGFVPQEDVMLRQLTVRDVLTHSAMTRLPVTWSTQDKLDLVEEVLGVLGLTHVAESIIGDEETRGVSGGERKRVNIGMELVADPLVLFLDEPTSGLDATSAKEVMEALQRVARRGTMVITVIHSPRYEIFELLDEVVLLAPGGRSVYVGAASKTLAYFESLGYQKPALGNPADFFIDVIAGRVEPDDSKDSAQAGTSIAIAQTGAKLGGNSEEVELQPMGGSAGGKATIHPAPTFNSVSIGPQFSAVKPVSQRQGSEPSINSWLGAGAFDAVAAAANVDRLVQEWRKVAAEHGHSFGSDRVKAVTERLPADGAGSGASFKETSLRFSEMDQAQVQELAVIFKRTVPGFWTQFWLEVKRCAMIDLRAPTIWVIDCILWIIAGIGLAIPGLDGEENFIAPLPLDLAELCPSIIRERCLNEAIVERPILRAGFFITMVNGAIACVWASRTFGLNKGVFFRERDRGMSVTAYWLARWLYDTGHALRGALIYLAFWLPIAQQRGTFGDWLGIILPLQFAAYGLGYLVSVLMRYERASIVSIVIAIGLAVTCGLVPPLDVVLTWGPMSVIWFLSYNFWAAQAMAILGASSQGLARVGHVLSEAGYYPDLFDLSCAMCIIIGLLYRVGTLISLKRIQPGK